MVRDRLTKLLTLRIAPAEHAMLDRLSEDSGLPMSAVARQLVRREYASRYGEEPSKPTRPKKKR